MPAEPRCHGNVQRTVVQMLAKFPRLSSLRCIARCITFLVVTLPEELGQAHPSTPAKIMIKQSRATARPVRSTAWQIFTGDDALPDRECKRDGRSPQDYINDMQIGHLAAASPKGGCILEGSTCAPNPEKMSQASQSS